MALTLKLSDICTVEWTISGYSYDWNETNYEEAGITTSTVTEGTSKPRGIEDSKDPPSSGTSRSVSGSFNYGSLNSAQNVTFYSYTKHVNGTYYATGSATIKVWPMPSYSYEVGADRITVTVNGVSKTKDNWRYFNIFIVDSSKETVAEMGWTKYTAASFTKTLSGLKKNSTYTVGVWIASASDGSDCIRVGGAKKFTTLAYTLWSWTSSNGTATAAQTQMAKRILDGDLELLVDGPSSTNGFSHLVWNDFVDKVMEMRRLKDGLGQWHVDGGKLLDYEECKVQAGDTLSAHIYNSVKTQIGSIRATNILDVEANEDPITSHSILHLATVLNQIFEST